MSDLVDEWVVKEEAELAVGVATKMRNRLIQLIRT